ncbi:unnamed protein product [Closterium sp. Naga37s-1]|nr:unnamed protein product [Closterium sp. Naga37s-1]
MACSPVTLFLFPALCVILVHPLPSHVLLVTSLPLSAQLPVSAPFQIIPIVLFFNILMFLLFTQLLITPSRLPPPFLPLKGLSFLASPSSACSSAPMILSSSSRVLPWEHLSPAAIFLTPSPVDLSLLPPPCLFDRFLHQPAPAPEGLGFRVTTDASALPRHLAPFSGISPAELSASALPQRLTSFPRISPVEPSASALPRRPAPLPRISPSERSASMLPQRLALPSRISSGAQSAAMSSWRRTPPPRILFAD